MRAPGLKFASAAGASHPAETAENRATAGVYVHFPWCLAKCPYCDFVSYAAERERIDHVAYADAVIRELERRADGFGSRRVETVFFGGGTPSLWDARQLGRVLDAVRTRLACSADLEVTVECNPTSIDAERARALLAVGVNRLSIGVQAMRDERLRALGRLHDAQQGAQAVKDVIAAGVPRVSADLIFGTPGQSASAAATEAVELLDLGVEHVSAYQLTIEPGTRFGELARRGRLPLADDGMVADAFLAIDGAITSRGLQHYEISNYALPGAEARHNLGYWRGDEYLGLGCGAYGFARHDGVGQPASGVRWRNPTAPEAYVAGEGTDLEEALDGETLLRERIMLGLRLAGGFDLAASARAVGVPGWTSERERAAQWLVAHHRVTRTGDRLRVPRQAWLWTDDTAARLF